MRDFPFIKTTVTCIPHRKDRQKQKGCKVERAVVREGESFAALQRQQVFFSVGQLLWTPSGCHVYLVHQLRLVEHKACLQPEQLFWALPPPLPRPPRWQHFRQAHRKLFRVGCQRAPTRWSQHFSAFQLAFHCGAARTCLGNGYESASVDISSALSGCVLVLRFSVLCVVNKIYKKKRK